jgi:hypothetical protein
VPRALAVVLTLLASAAIAVAFAACGDDDGDEVSGVEAGTFEALFQTQVADGIIGSFAITPSGADHGRARRLNPSIGLRP